MLDDEVLVDELPEAALLLVLLVVVQLGHTVGQLYGLPLLEWRTRRPRLLGSVWEAGVLEGLPK